MSAAAYKILLVKRGGIVAERRHLGAPAEHTLLRWGTSVKAGFVIRYFPSKRGWRLLDVRNAQFFSLNGRLGKWVGHVRGQKYYETEDAAVMVAIHNLG